MANTREDILRRIKACLNLAERGGTEEEATLAAEMASAMALKYGIDLAAVQGATINAKPRGFTDHKVYKSEKYQKWLMDLVCGVAATHAAKVYFTTWRDRETDYHVIAREELGDAIRLTVEYLAQAIMRMNRDAVKGRGLTQQGRSEFRAAFRMAAAMRVRHRLEERAEQVAKKDDVAQKTTGHNALVVRDYFERELRELQEWMDDAGFTFKQRRASTRTIRSADGWAAGVKAGEAIGLEKQLR
jgi:hypothetical protein